MDTTEESKEEDVAIADAANHPKWVAIKKIHMKDSNSGLSMEAIREIKLLQELDHPNVMKILDVFNHKQNIHLVLSYMETDLYKVIQDKDTQLGEADVKSYLGMILEAVAHCHEHWILHRDIKPENFLVGEDGQLQLADFGLAKIYGSPDRRMSHRVCTLWYRPPELLFGARAYGAAMDMWSVGCVFAELMLRRPYLKAERDSEISQLTTIFAHLGTPTEKTWPSVSLLPSFAQFEATSPPSLERQFPGSTSEALDLLGKMLSLDPNQRISAREALQHPYFSTEPLGTPIDQLPKPIRKAV